MLGFNISSGELNKLSKNIKLTLDKLNNIQSIEPTLKEKLVTKYPTVEFSVNSPRIKLDNQANITKQIRAVNLPKQVKEVKPIQQPKITDINKVKVSNYVKVNSKDIKDNIVNTLLTNDQ